mgnify:CR=1 FL=1
MQFNKYGKCSECWTNSLITVEVEKSLVTKKVAHRTNGYKTEKDPISRHQTLQIRQFVSYARITKWPNKSN